jgi:multidrug efflux pump subunit AcrB
VALRYQAFPYQRFGSHKGEVKEIAKTLIRPNEVDIPVSLIGAFFIMYLADFSINVLTMLAVVLATGLVVDDGIVVTENIYKKIEGGMNPREAAIKGSGEIFFAVLSIHPKHSASSRSCG